MTDVLTEVVAARRAKAEATERLGEALRCAARFLVHVEGLSGPEAARRMGVSHQRLYVLLRAEQDTSREEAA